jgi:adenylate cyclase class 2
MDHLEIELKFYMSDFTALRSRVQNMGAVCLGRRTFEHNVRFDTGDGRLLKNHCLLRLRKDQNTTLTFKSPPAEAGTRFKIFRELEVSVDDFDAMDAILNALGYVSCQTYQKWRETWQLNEATLCMDTLPFGRFLEIEGSPDPIMQVIHDLGLQWKHRILSSYLEIFNVLRDLEGLPFSDVTFDRFKTVSIAFDRHRRRFEAGDNDGEEGSGITADGMHGHP